jgi:hypothetical protein
MPMLQMLRRGVPSWPPWLDGLAPGTSVQPCGLLPPRVRLRARVHPRCALRKHLRLSLSFLVRERRRAQKLRQALQPGPWAPGSTPKGHGRGPRPPAPPQCYLPRHVLKGR